MRKLGKALLIAASAAAALVITGTLDVQVDWRGNTAQALGLFGSDDVAAEPAPSPPFWQDGSDQPPIVPQGVPGSFADLVERTSPGVVYVRTLKMVEYAPMMPLQPFRRPGGGEHPMPGSGSGFVISSDGYIVTNDHVVDGASEISVTFNDGTKLDAVVVGRDERTDIALIKVETDTPLSILPLGDSSRVRAGEWVIAIGNPFDFDHSVSAGIVSAKHRNIEHGPYDDYIQTDAAINRGNSGGPLINMAGEVVGINTATNEAADGIGFAVPIDMAKQILPQLRSAGHVTRGWLGVKIQAMTEETSQELGLDRPRGALVNEVLAGTPAARAGIEDGDVILRFDGTDIGDWNELPRVVAATPVEKEVEVIVLRDGKDKKLGVVIAELEDPEVVRVSARDPGPSTEFGLSVQDLTDEIAEELGLDSGRGVLVAGVDPAGPAREQVLRGDVILEVDREEIADVEALEKALEKADERVLLLIRRGENQHFVTVKRSS